MLEEGTPQAQGPPGGGLSGEKTQAKGRVGSCTAPPQTSPPTSLSLLGSSLDPGPQQGDFLSLQCLKAGGTSVRHPATPSSLTAQGR